MSVVPPPGRTRIVSFGDVVNDIVAVPRTEIRPDTDTTSTIRARPGGSAANTAAWLGSLGADVDFVGCVGHLDAHQHEGFLREMGVVPHLAIAPGAQTSMIVIVVDDQRRSMLTERGANALLAISDIPDGLLDDAAVLHMTGYTLLDGPRSAGLQELIARAHASGAVVSLNPGSAGYIADFGRDEFAAGIAGADIVFANVAEGTLLCDETVPERIAAVLGERYGIAVITNGYEDVLVAERGAKVARIPVPSARVVDPTGAGDAMAAGFLHHWRASGDAVAAAAAGVAVASRAVMVFGGRPVI